MVVLAPPNSAFSPPPEAFCLVYHILSPLRSISGLTLLRFVTFINFALTLSM